jgi:hypothetical protein
MCVCRHFRALAVHTPLLWNILDLQRDHQLWQVLCLRRSQNTPLYISGHLDAVLPHLSRTSVARLSIRETIGTGDLLDADAPLLKKLNLESSSTFHLTKRFLGGTATNLTRLVIGGPTAILHEGIALPALQHVYFHSGSRTFPQGSLEPLVGMLERATHLRSVKIESFSLSSTRIGLPADEIVPVSRRISLPHLDALIIGGTRPAEISALARSLPIPATTLVMDTVVSGVVETRGSLPLNYSIIFDHWLEFTRTKPNASILTSGAVYPCSVAGIEHGWCSLAFSDGMDPGEASQCTFACVPQGEHRMFPHMYALYIIGVMQSPPWFAELDVRFGLGATNHLQEVYLHGLSGTITAPEHMQHLRDWLINRNGLIKRVVVRQSDERACTFAEELRRDGIVSDVSIENDTN